MTRAATQKARFTGVSRSKTGDASVAFLRWEGKSHKLGTWQRELDAAVAFDRASLWFGRDGALNIPSESLRLGPCSPEDLRRLAVAQRKLARGSASVFRGVSLRAGTEWWATVRVDGVIERVGAFKTEMEAAHAYDRLLLGLGGDRSKLNFPGRQHDLISASELRAQLRAQKKSKLTSPFRGVSLGPNNRWHAEIHAEGRHRRLGEWAEESDAAEAYDRAAIFFHGYRGAAARRNFPDRALTPASPEELQAESRARTKATRTSRFRGVTYVDPADGYPGWRAEILRDGVLHAIGRYDDEIEAAIAYDRVARAWFGAEAKLNFPDEPWPAASLEEIRLEKRAQFKATTTSRYNGVSWAEHMAAWVASIIVDHVYYFLGYHDDEEVAARAYDRKRWELRGEGPYNFPDDLPDGRKRPKVPRRQARSTGARA